MKTDEIEFNLGRVGAPLPDWRKVADTSEDEDNDEDAPIDPSVKLVLGFDPDDGAAEESAKNRRGSEDVKTVRDALREDTSGIVKEFDAALAIEDPHARGIALVNLIGKIPSEIGKAEEITAAIESLLLDGFIAGAGDEPTG